MTKSRLRKLTRLGCCASAAAVLLGWYLMLPPIDVANWRVNNSAPLSQWQRAGDYASLAECMAVREQVLGHVIPPALDQTPQTTIRYTRLDSRCVRGDDPRLAPAPRL
jgi:hypothetical protein